LLTEKYAEDLEFCKSKKKQYVEGQATVRIWRDLPGIIEEKVAFRGGDEWVEKHISRNNAIDL